MRHFSFSASTHVEHARGAGARPLLLAGCILSFAASAPAATFTVRNSNDANAGSLRAAIRAAERTAARDEIVFAIPGAGPHTIVLASELPVLSRPLTINGYSQPGAAEATRTSPARLRIAIDARNALRGIDIGGDAIEIRGLAVHAALEENVFIEGDDNVVAGNHIGTNLAGDATVQLDGLNVSLYGSNNLLGGPRFADRNVITGRSVEVWVNGSSQQVRNNRIGTNAAGTAGLGFGYGVMVESDGNLVRDNLVSGCFVGVELLGDYNQVQGNRIGTDVGGTRSILSSGLGLNVEGGDHNLIGGTAPNEGNLISGNPFGGIQLERGDDPPEEEVGPAEGNRVLGNLIGTDVSGTVALGNGVDFGGSGVSIHGSNDNVIGGLARGAANVIAYNAEDGIDIEGEAPGNSILRNHIFANGGLGIDLAFDGVTRNDAGDLDSGPNELLNFPLVSAADAATGSVTWTLDGLASTAYRLEFFSSSVCDGSGSGEGEQYLGAVEVLTDATGRAAAATAPAASLTRFHHVTMTATRRTPSAVAALAGDLADTSEFSPCQVVN